MIPMIRKSKISPTKYCFTLLLFLVLFVFQQGVSYTGGRVADALYSRSLDPDNAFLWITLHHIAQTLLTLPAIALLCRVQRIRFRPAPHIDRSGVYLLAFFSLAMILYAVLYYVVGGRLGLLVPFGYVSTSRNVLGVLAFQLLLSGPSEELLFRMLPITLFRRIFCARPGHGVGVSVVLSALLFSVAHISWYTDPFTLSYHWYQLIYAFTLGLVYGFVYVKKRSIVYPMLMHSLSNVIVIGLGFVYNALA